MCVSIYLIKNRRVLDIKGYHLSLELTIYNNDIKAYSSSKNLDSF